VVLMNSGKVEQVGSPQDVWDHPASPFVYGFLGDVNLFHGRAHEGEMLIGADQNALRVASPEHQLTQDSKAFAYVRPHDLEVARYTLGATGIVAKLVRAIVVGPTARLELLPLDVSAAGQGEIIEAHLPAQQAQALAFKEGETLVLSLRKARVFVEEAQDFVI
jgi:sulfate transport system ATP-binding protein